MFLILILLLLIDQNSYSTPKNMLYKAPRPSAQTVVGPLLPCNDNLLTNLEKKFQECCSQIIDLIISNTTIPCNAVSITQGTSIESPGYYCLNNDIVGQIVIDANNVVLDLNNHTITTNFASDGIVVNTGVNRIIKNGRITNSTWGIVLNGNTTTKVTNIVVSFCNIGSILVINSINLLLQSIMSEFSRIGCYFGQANNANVLENIIIAQPQQGFIFETLNNSVIRNCHVFDGESVDAPLIGPSNYGFGLLGGSNNIFENCSVQRYNAFATGSGFLFDNSTTIILKNCWAQNISSFFPVEEAVATGFFCTESASRIQLLHCSCQDIWGLTSATGFNLAGNDLLTDYCLSQSVVSLAFPENAYGFLCTSTVTNITSCGSYGAFNGFMLSTPASLDYCQASHNTTGFIITHSQATVGNCRATHNNDGFDAPNSGFIYNCFAADNASMNYINVPNTQNTNAQVDTTIVGPSGPFAGGNLFM